MTTRRWAVLAPLLTASCALFGIDPDANDDDSGGSNDSADDAHTNDEGYTDEGGGDLSCPGTAFTRTDDPGTAICLDGLNSFECAWGSGNPSVDGFMVDGEYDSIDALLTLWFPDNPEASAFTPFTFDVLFNYEGNDMVLWYLSSRSGDYRLVSSWADAVEGDQGVCGGSGGGGGSGTCREQCASDYDCSPGESCLASNEGDICLPTECQGCWDANLSCSSYPDTCAFAGCT